MLETNRADILARSLNEVKFGTARRDDGARTRIGQARHQARVGSAVDEKTGMGLLERGQVVDLDRDPAAEPFDLAGARRLGWRTLYSTSEHEPPRKRLRGLVAQLNVVSGVCDHDRQLLPIGARSSRESSA